jgi:hypothetical protein
LTPEHTNKQTNKQTNKHQPVGHKKATILVLHHGKPTGRAQKKPAGAQQNVHGGHFG